MKHNKPIIETMINTAALALITFGVASITARGNTVEGYIALVSGFILEFFKYWGRQKEIW